jgi:hypothetical protein
MFNLSHCELTYSQQTLSWRDFVSVSHTYLSSSKGHLAIVEFDQSSEVDEDTLGCLRSEVALHVARWTNLQLEHKIEGLCGRQIISSFRILDTKLNNDLVDLFCVVVISVHKDPLKAFNLFWLLLLRHNLSDVLLDQLISAFAETSLDIFDHKIGELLNVTTGFKNFLNNDICCCHFEHVFFENEMIAPECFNVELQSRTEGTKIKETSDASINFESGGNKEFSLEKILNLLTSVFDSEINWFNLFNYENYMTLQLLQL